MFQRIFLATAIIFSVLQVNAADKIIVNCEPNRMGSNSASITGELNAYYQNMGSYKISGTLLVSYFGLSSGVSRVNVTDGEYQDSSNLFFSSQSDQVGNKLSLEVDEINGLGLLSVNGRTNKFVTNCEINLIRNRIPRPKPKEFNFLRTIHSTEKTIKVVRCCGGHHLPRECPCEW